MRKNYIGILPVIALSLALVGCGDVPDLSEKQSDLIAEYSGGVLLRYSNRYDLRLVTADQDGDGVEDGLETPIPSETPQEPEESETPATASPAIETVAPTEEEPEPTEVPTVPLNDIYGISGLDFSYSKAEFTDSYPKNDDDVIISAGDGEKLYVMTFKVKNTSGSDVAVDLTSRQINYELSVAGGKIAPTISLLPNGGLNFLMTTVKAGKSEDAILIFKVDKAASSSKEISLTVSEGDKTATLDL